MTTERKETDEFIVRLKSGDTTPRIFEYDKSEWRTQDETPVTKLTDYEYDIPGIGRATKLDPPVNVAHPVPTDTLDNWEEEARKWRALRDKGYLDKVHKDGTLIRAHGGFYPLTIKAFYVIGIMHNSCQAVSMLLQNEKSRQKFYMLAYGVFAANMDLLGRCLQGNDTTDAKPKRGGTQDIIVGFQWLKNPSHGTLGTVVDTDETIEGYSIKTLTQLRHFAAHGRATSQSELETVDYNLLEKLLPKFSDGLEAYWAALGKSAPPATSEILCNNLAKARIAEFQNWAVYDFLLELSGGRSITDIFRKFKGSFS